MTLFRIICLLVALFCVQTYHNYHFKQEAVLNRLKCAEYSKELQVDGYCKEWADHKAQVEFNLIPVDSLYWDIEND